MCYEKKKRDRSFKIPEKIEKIITISTKLLKKDGMIIPD